MWKQFWVLLLATSLAASSTSAEPFSFVAIGDMPYGTSKKVTRKFEALIDVINAAKPAFTIHVGDTKSGSSQCTNAALDAQRNYMNSFDSALFYTPGDNEWTDCHRGKAGGFDPLDRLAYIRSTYFDKPTTLGKAPIAVERQADVMAKYRTFVENARFLKSDVMFMTAHVVGSNNNFEVRDRKAVMEFFERDKANVAWLQSSFDKAIAESAKAVVVAIHGDIFQFGFNLFRRELHLRHSGYKNFAEMLKGKAKEFAKPVLLIYGDTHRFRMSRPFIKTAPNITALEVYGAKHMHAIEVLVAPDKAFPFAFRPLYNPAMQ